MWKNYYFENNSLSFLHKSIIFPSQIYSLPLLFFHSFFAWNNALAPSPSHSGRHLSVIRSTGLFSLQAIGLRIHTFSFSMSCLCLARSILRKSLPFCFFPWPTFVGLDDVFFLLDHRANQEFGCKKNSLNNYYPIPQWKPYWVGEKKISNLLQSKFYQNLSSFWSFSIFC